MLERSSNRRLFSIIGLACMIVASAAAPAVADAIYTYTGNPYTAFNGLSCPSVCGITATLDLAAPLPPNSGNPIILLPVTPISFTVTDGSNTITQSNDLTANFGVATNSSGQIDLWDFTVDYINGGIQIDITSNNRGNSTKDETSTPTSYAENTLDAGIWTSSTTSTIPEPSSILLVLPVLAILPVIRRACLRRVRRRIS